MSQKQLRLLAVAMLASAVPQLLAIPVRAGSFAVNSSRDDASAHDVNLGDGLCADSYGVCTLRAAIEESNASPGPHVITFATAMDIALDTTVGSLPDMFQQVKIDASAVWDSGTYQPGVSVNGVNQTFQGLGLRAPYSEVYGLHLHGFSTGLDIRSRYNTIGGTGYGQTNVIGGNSFFGINIQGSDAGYNVIHNNWIGLNRTGESSDPNFRGISIMDGATDNDIGGTSIGSGNYISGNSHYGVYVGGTGTDYNRFGDNRIGLPVYGAQDVGNGDGGILVDNGARETRIGVVPMLGNQIQRNNGPGVFIRNSSHADVHNSIIAYNAGAGVRVEGPAALSNEIWGNAIYSNDGKGIELIAGGNAGMAAPVITQVGGTMAKGSACALCGVQVFSDPGDEGQTWHGTVVADSLGNWTYSGVLYGPFITATNTDAVGNTSEFSAPAALNGGGTCSSPIPISCGQQVSGSTSGHTNTISLYSCTGWDESGPEVVYSVVLPTGSVYTVTASLSNLSADLDVFLLAAGGCSAGQCLSAGSYGDLQAVATNVPPGTYYIAVDGYQGASGSYNLAVACTPAGPPGSHRVFLPVLLRSH